jgi:hypothetical protein
MLATYLRCQILRGKGVALVCSKSGIIADGSDTVGDNTVTLLESADVRADFDNRARERYCTQGLEIMFCGEGRCWTWERIRTSNDGGILQSIRECPLLDLVLSWLGSDDLNLLLCRLSEASAETQRQSKKSQLHFRKTHLDKELPWTRVWSNGRADFDLLPYAWEPCRCVLVYRH